MQGVWSALACVQDDNKENMNVGAYWMPKEAADFSIHPVFPVFPVFHIVRYSYDFFFFKSREKHASFSH